MGCFRFSYELLFLPGLGSPTRAGRGLAECSFAATPGDRPGVGSWGAFGWMEMKIPRTGDVLPVLSKWMMENP